MSCHVSVCEIIQNFMMTFLSSFDSAFLLIPLTHLLAHLRTAVTLAPFLWKSVSQPIFSSTSKDANERSSCPWSKALCKQSRHSSLMTTSVHTYHHSFWIMIINFAHHLGDFHNISFQWTANRPTCFQFCAICKLIGGKSGWKIQGIAIVEIWCCM